MTTSKAVKELWLEKYKGKYSVQCSVANSTPKPAAPSKEKAFTSVRNHKQLKISHQPSESQSGISSIDLYDQYIETDIIPLAEDESFDPVQYWQEQYYIQMDLARIAFDALAV